MKTTVLPTSSLTPGNFRKDLGDLTELRADIAENGLRRPLVVTEQGLVLSGDRRLAAFEGSEIPVVVVDSMEEAVIPIRGDLLDSLPMLITERINQGFAIEDLDIGARKQYKSQMQKWVKGKNERPPQRRGLAETLAPALGFSEPLFHRARTVTKYAREPGPFQAQAIRACEEMNETGKVTGVYETFRLAKKGQKKTKPPPNKFSVYYQNRAKSTSDQAWNILQHLDSSTPGLANLSAEMIHDGNENGQTEEMLRMAGQAIHQLGLFRKRLKKETIK